MACLVFSLSAQVFATNDSEIAAIAEKLAENPASDSFTDQEIINLFRAVYGSNTYGADISEIVKWTKSMPTVEAASLSIGFHEETHVFTSGIENCERNYDGLGIDILQVGDSKYMFGDNTVVVSTIPLYIPTTMAIKDLSGYKIINNYFSNKKMFAVKYGLSGMLNEYYAFTRELGFLVKYRNFCSEYDVPDTASDRISKLAEACREWVKASNEYIKFTKENFDGAGYGDLEKMNAIYVFESINEEFRGIDVTPPPVKVKEKIEVSVKSAVEVETESKAATIDNTNDATGKTLPGKIKSGNIWEVISNFITTLFHELRAWTMEFFAT